MNPSSSSLPNCAASNEPAPSGCSCPTHALGLTLGERLARDGCDWANLRFVTPLDIAVRMAAPFLVEQGLNPSEESLGPPLIMSLLLDLPVEGGYFRPMAEHPTMADALVADRA